MEQNPMILSQIAFLYGGYISEIYKEKNTVRYVLSTRKNHVLLHVEYNESFSSAEKYSVWIRCYFNMATGKNLTKKRALKLTLELNQKAKQLFGEKFGFVELAY